MRIFRDGFLDFDGLCQIKGIFTKSIIKQHWINIEKEAGSNIYVSKSWSEAFSFVAGMADLAGSHPSKHGGGTQNKRHGLLAFQVNENSAFYSVKRSFCLASALKNHENTRELDFPCKICKI